MPKPKQFYMSKQVYFPMSLWKRIDEYVTYIKNRTGAEVNQSSVIRTLIDEALTARGITNEDNEPEKIETSGKPQPSS